VATHQYTRHPWTRSMSFLKKKRKLNLAATMLALAVVRAIIIHRWSW
jgi:hypothetical protein